MERLDLSGAKQYWLQAVSRSLGGLSINSTIELVSRQDKCQNWQRQAVCLVKKIKNWGAAMGAARDRLFVHQMRGGNRPQIATIQRLAQS